MQIRELGLIWSAANCVEDMRQTFLCVVQVGDFNEEHGKCSASLHGCVPSMHFAEYDTTLPLQNASLVS